jgi:hypothetical protein
MLILLEFNELCPSLLRRFIDEGLLPGFRRLYETSLVCTTNAEEEPPNLEPWVQWPTIHSGLSFAEHGVFHLGDGRRMEQKCLATLLSDAGVRVGVFGSMNLNYRRLNGYMIPDAWDQEGKTQPESLQPFFNFVSRQVQESSQVTALTKGDLVRFGMCLVRNGLSASTVSALVRQLATERREPALRWRRPSLLDLIQYDLFRRLNRRHDVQFATLFFNSTAHYQHYYWRNMQPEQFAVPPPATDHESLANAIRYGYQQMDRVVTRVLNDYPDAVVMLLTALSQQPWAETTKCTFRPRSFTDFLAFAGVPSGRVEVKPVMAEEFHLLASDPSTTDDVERRLKALFVEDRPLVHVERSGNNLYCGCAITTVEGLESTIHRTTDGVTCRFADLLHMVHSMRSGRHHPDGAWWIRTGQHRVLDQSVPLTAVAPTVLAHFDVELPSAMEGDPLVGLESSAAAPSRA